MQRIQAQLNRRRPGQSALTSPRDEKDAVEVLSGIDPDSGLTENEFDHVFVGRFDGELFLALGARDCLPGRDAELLLAFDVHAPVDTQQQDEEPDERLMRSIEEKINIPESRKDDFRREIMNYIGALAIEGKKFTYDTNDRLRRALEMKLFEDQKDTIKLTTLVSNVVDRETQAKIDVVKNRLIKNYGYCEICATDVLNFVASIFARGDVT